jgi:hypothetical protein
LRLKSEERTKLVYPTNNSAWFPLQASLLSSKDAPKL